MPPDIFPSFAPPQVKMQTEAPRVAPEEVKSLVTSLIENSINGTPQVTAVRSSNTASIPVVRVIFNWETNIYQTRQLVTERLQYVAGKILEGAETPQISPTSSPVDTSIKYAFTSVITTPLIKVQCNDWLSSF